MLTKTLQDYHDLFQETLKCFLEYQGTDTNENSPSLLTLRTKLQSTMIKLIDQQHNIEFIFMYSRFSQRDMSQLTQKVKDMRTPLHGIGVSLLMKHERSKNASSYESTEDKMYPNVPIYQEIMPTTEQLSDTCALTLQACLNRIERFKVPPRSLLSTLLWPFPRLFVRTKQETTPNDLHEQDLAEKLASYESSVRDWRIKHADINHQSVTRQVAYLFQFNMVHFANSVHALAELVDTLDRARPQHKRLWMPCLSIKRWVKPSLSNKAQFGNQINHRISSIAESTYSMEQDEDEEEQTLNEVVVQEDQPDICLMHVNNRPGPRDPDVDAPSTRREKFFNGLAKVVDWWYSPATVFALKTAGGFILLSLPAYLPQSVGWFTSWGGQWVANTLLMWMIPMAGMFNFTQVSLVLVFVVLTCI